MALWRLTLLETWTVDSRAGVHGSQLQGRRCFCFDCGFFLKFAVEMEIQITDLQLGLFLDYCLKDCLIKYHSVFNIIFRFIFVFVLTLHQWPPVNHCRLENVNNGVVSLAERRCCWKHRDESKKKKPTQLRQFSDDYVYIGFPFTSCNPPFMWRKIS